ncbi:MAG: triose-phosphate isomerase [Candidatus Methylopumilus sp.]|nr:triose-phosphate isomerase [Candidatus Methylopumilus sp.]
MRRKIVVGNWKMNGSLASNEALLKALVEKIPQKISTDIVICAPYPYLFQTQSYLKNSSIRWGAQNVAKFESGAFTGEVSVSMLKEFGASYVIIGHSERSTAYCESDENIATKLMMVKQAGMTPILCVGESLIEREAGIMEKVVSKQLDTIVEMYGEDIFDETIIAYEPVWAIGSDMAASPEQAQTMHQFIREKLSPNAKVGKSLKIIYGGSVNPQNALQLFSMPDVDGGLVGRASLNASDFQSICHSAEI